MRVLRVCRYQLDFVRSLGREVKWHGKREEETAHYCNECEVRIRQQILKFYKLF